MNMNEQQIKILAQWLKEYNLDQSLESMDAEWEMTSEGKPVRNGETAEYDEHIAVGQIRLVSRALTQQASRPVYLAVLRKSDDEKVWLAVPFSAYSVPAVPEEICLRKDGSVALRTLCLWNRRWVQEERLTCSWVVDSLSDSERELCEQWLNGKGSGMCETVAAIKGAPIVRPDDPRHAYLEKEKHVLDALGGDEHLDADEDDDEEDVIPFYNTDSSALKMVADEKGKYEV